MSYIYSPLVEQPPAGAARALGFSALSSSTTTATIHASHALSAGEHASGALTATLSGRARSITVAASSTGSESATLTRTRAISGGLWGSSAPGPGTALHYAAGANFDSSGPTFVYLLQPYGYNLADASNVTEVDELPAGVKALVYVGLTNGVDSAFLSFMAPFQSGSHPNLWGFYLSDEPDPNVVPAANLKAESDWIHANFPGVITFIALQTLGTPNSPTYVPTSPAVAYNPATTGIDLYGIDPYPVRAQFPGGVDYSVIGASVSAAIASGIPQAKLVPVYQGFGGGGYPSWTLPTPVQEQTILQTWAGLLPSVPFDYTYAWGSQLGDFALENSPSQAAVFAAQNAAKQAALTSGHALAEAAASNASESATLGRSRPLALAATAADVTSASLNALHPGLNAFIASSGATTATLGRSRALADAASSNGATAALIHATHVLVSAKTSTSSTSATLTRKRALASSIASTSLFLIGNQRQRFLLLAATALSSSLAALGRVTPISAQSAAFSATVATLSSTHAVAATANATGALGATLSRPRALDAETGSQGVFASPAITRGRALLLVAATASALAAAIVKPARVFVVVAGRVAVIGRLAVAPSATRLSVVPSEEEVVSGTTVTAFDPMDPQDVDFFTFDWSSRTIADPIVGATVTSVPATDLTVSALILDPNFVQVTCSAGPACGESVGLKCAVTLASGRNLHWTARLPVISL